MATDFVFDVPIIPYNSDFIFGAVSIYNVFVSDLAFTSIFADADASLVNGKFYVSTKSEVNTIDNSDHTLKYFYSRIAPGCTNETLDPKDIDDLLVIYTPD